MNALMEAMMKKKKMPMKEDMEGSPKEEAGESESEARAEGDKKKKKGFSDLVDTFKAISTDKQLSAVRDAFYKQFNSGNKSYGMDSEPYCYVQETFLNDGYVICSMGGSYYRVDFTKKEGQYVFDAKADWKEVEQAYIAKMVAGELVTLKAAAKKRKPVRHAVVTSTNRGSIVRPQPSRPGAAAGQAMPMAPQPKPMMQPGNVTHIVNIHPDAFHPQKAGQVAKRESMFAPDVKAVYHFKPKKPSNASPVKPPEGYHAQMTTGEIRMSRLKGMATQFDGTVITLALRAASIIF